MIGVNWGSSNFRAYRVAADGAVVEERASSRGALSMRPDEFHAGLLAEVGDWVRQGESNVLMCGMVGSRSGWVEVPYLPVPATFEQITASCFPLDCAGLQIRIVPGLRDIDVTGVPEVMRGEETEIFGAQCDLTQIDRICLPGTHTKWVQVRPGKIDAFTTYMTGDLFQAVREKTALRSFCNAGADDHGAFLQGVSRAKDPGGLTHHLFGVRTLVLMGTLQEQQARSYLSGLLIGHEVQSTLQPGERVHLIGDSRLCALYAAALHGFGCVASVEEPHAAVRGLIRIGMGQTW